MKTDLTQRLGFMGAAALALAGLIAGATTASGQVPMDNDDISGEVRGPTGPEAACGSSLRPMTLIPGFARLS